MDCFTLVRVFSRLCSLRAIVNDEENDLLRWHSVGVVARLPCGDLNRDDDANVVCSAQGFVEILSKAVNAHTHGEIGLL